MPFEKGHEKVGGRKKGTPNRVSSELRVLLKNLLYEEIERLPSYLNELDPKDRIEICIRLMNYAYPKVKPIEPTVGEPFEFEW